MRCGLVLCLPEFQGSNLVFRPVLSQTRASGAYPAHDASSLAVERVTAATSLTTVKSITLREITAERDRPGESLRGGHPNDGL
jgi:hypothetical protein